jgi:hypothetical protein
MMNMNYPKMTDNMDIPNTNNNSPHSPGNSNSHSRSHNHQHAKKHYALYVSNYDDVLGLSAAYIHPIPLGLTTAAWIKDQLASLCRLVQQQNYQDLDAISSSSSLYPNKWLYVSFKTENNPQERNAARSVAERLSHAPNGPSNIKDAVFISKRNFDETIKEMMHYKFVLAPSGRGYDTHRILEALMLGRIPIVKWAPYLCAYDGLPILRVKDWEDITWELLYSTWHRLQHEVLTFHPERLFIDYWIEKINRTVHSPQ